jgi:hypothetical protein
MRDNMQGAVKALLLINERETCRRSDRVHKSVLTNRELNDTKLGDPIKRHTHPLFFAPHNVAGYPLPVSTECQCEMLRYASGTQHFKRRARNGHVADHAIYFSAVELNCSGSQHIETSGTARFHVGMMCRVV